MRGATRVSAPHLGHTTRWPTSSRAAWARAWAPLVLVHAQGTHTRCPHSSRRTPAGTVAGPAGAGVPARAHSAVFAGGRGAGGGSGCSAQAACAGATIDITLNRPDTTPCCRADAAVPAGRAARLSRTPPLITHTGEKEEQKEGEKGKNENEKKKKGRRREAVTPQDLRGFFFSFLTFHFGLHTNDTAHGCDGGGGGGFESSCCCCCDVVLSEDSCAGCWGNGSAVSLRRKRPDASRWRLAAAR